MQFRVPAWKEIRARLGTGHAHTAEVGGADKEFQRLQATDFEPTRDLEFLAAGLVKIPTCAAPSLTTIYGLDRPAHVLVRPDGCIAYVATDNSQTRTPGAPAEPGRLTEDCGTSFSRESVCSARRRSRLP